MKKIIRISIVIFCLCIACCGTYIYKKIYDQQKNIQSFSNDIKIINPIKTILFSEFGAKDFTCTGLTFDYKNNSFWICDYGALSINDPVYPRLIEVDKDFSKIINEIRLDSLFKFPVNLQGITYDLNRDCFWLAIGKSVIAINKDGFIIDDIDLGKFGEYLSNGIAYDTKDDSLWILYASKYLIHYKKDGTILMKYDLNLANQDQICIKGNYLYITVGADYQGENNYICKFSIEEGKIVDYFKTIGSSSVEGICHYKGKFMIVNDGLYHSDLIGKSYVVIYSDDLIL